jgi:hypothetical protein
MPKNLEQKGLTKVVKVCVKITPNFVSKYEMDVKRGSMVSKRRQNGVKTVLDGCSLALAGLDRL